MEARTDVTREAVGLAKEEEVSRLAKVYSQLNDTAKLIAIAYIEGMAAAGQTQPPRATA